MKNTKSAAKMSRSVNDDENNFFRKNVNILFNSLKKHKYGFRESVFNLKAQNDQLKQYDRTRSCFDDKCENSVKNDVKLQLDQGVISISDNP